MRNLKKFLALVLAMMMVFSLMLTANAAVSDYPDGDKVKAEHVEALDVLTALKIFQGDALTGKMDPDGPFTRAQLAGLAYRMFGNTDQAELFAGEQLFTDVPTTHWAAGFINYAATKGWVKGTSETARTYNPSGNVTGNEVLTLLLQLLGYGQKEGEFTGANYPVKPLSYAQDLNMLDGFTGADMGKTFTRQQVAELAFRVLNQEMQTLGTINYEGTGKTLGEEKFGLEYEVGTDEFGRPSNIWSTKDGKVEVVEAYAPVYKNIDETIGINDAAAEDECEIVEIGGLSGTKATPISTYYVDGEELDPKLASSDGKAELSPYDTISTVGAEGRITEVYMVEGSAWIVEINTYLAKVDRVETPPADDNGHKHPDFAALTIYVAPGASNPATNYVSVTGTVIIQDMKEEEKPGMGDWVLVQMTIDSRDASNNPEKVTVYECEMPDNTKTGGAVSAPSDGTTKVGDGTYDDADKLVYIETGLVRGTYPAPTYFDKDTAIAAAKPLLPLLDKWGNLIGLVRNIDIYNLLTVTQIEWKTNPGFSFGGRAIFTGYNNKGDQVTGYVDKISAKVGGSVSTADVTATETQGEFDPAVGLASVSIYWRNNGAYYKHIYRYTKTMNGTDEIYTLHYHDDVDSGDPIADLPNTYTIEKSGHFITAAGVSVYAIDDKTTFVFFKTDGTAFPITSRHADFFGELAASNNVTNLCVYYEDGTAKFVVVGAYTLKATGSTSTASAFDGYVTGLATAKVGGSGAYANLYANTYYDRATGARGIVYSSDQLQKTGWYYKASYTATTGISNADRVKEGLSTDAGNPTTASTAALDPVHSAVLGKVDYLGDHVGAITGYDAGVAYSTLTGAVNGYVSTSSASALAQKLNFNIFESVTDLYVISRVVGADAVDNTKNDVKIDKKDVKDYVNWLKKDALIMVIYTGGGTTGNNLAQTIYIYQVGEPEETGSTKIVGPTYIRTGGAANTNGYVDGIIFSQLNGAYQLDTLDYGSGDAQGTADDNIIFKYSNTASTAAVISSVTLTITDAKGTTYYYSEKYTSGPAVAPGNHFFYVQVTGDIVGNAGEGTLKTTALTAGTYNWKITNGVDPDVTGTFTITSD